eukprot:jgi/Tetstr1/423735/TSEL_014367.t2
MPSSTSQAAEAMPQLPARMESDSGEDSDVDFAPTAWPQGGTAAGNVRPKAAAPAVPASKLPSGAVPPLPGRAPQAEPTAGANVTRAVGSGQRASSVDSATGLVSSLRAAMPEVRIEFRDKNGSFYLYFKEKKIGRFGDVLQDTVKNNLHTAIALYPELEELATAVRKKDGRVKVSLKKVSPAPVPTDLPGERHHGEAQQPRDPQVAPGSHMAGLPLPATPMTVSPPRSARIPPATAAEAASLADPPRAAAKDGHATPGALPAALAKRRPTPEVVHAKGKPAPPARPLPASAQPPSAPSSAAKDGQSLHAAPTKCSLAPGLVHAKGEATPAAQPPSGAVVQLPSAPAKAGLGGAATSRAAPAPDTEHLTPEVVHAKGKAAAPVRPLSAQPPSTPAKGGLGGAEPNRAAPVAPAKRCLTPEHVQAKRAKAKAPASSAPQPAKSGHFRGGPSQAPPAASTKASPAPGLGHPKGKPASPARPLPASAQPPSALAKGGMVGAAQGRATPTAPTKCRLAPELSQPKGESPQAAQPPSGSEVQLPAAPAKAGLGAAAPSRAPPAAGTEHLTPEVVQAKGKAAAPIQPLPASAQPPSAPAKGGLGGAEPNRAAPVAPAKRRLTPDRVQAKRAKAKAPASPAPKPAKSGHFCGGPTQAPLAASTKPSPAPGLGHPKGKPAAPARPLPASAQAPPAAPTKCSLAPGLVHAKGEATPAAQPPSGAVVQLPSAPAKAGLGGAAPSRAPPAGGTEHRPTPEVVQAKGGEAAPVGPLSASAQPPSTPAKSDLVGAEPNRAAPVVPAKRCLTPERVQAKRAKAKAPASSAPKPAKSGHFCGGPSQAPPAASTKASPAPGLGHPKGKPAAPVQPLPASVQQPSAPGTGDLVGAASNRAASVVPAKRPLTPELVHAN